jgi:hypothetical protein
MMDRIPLHSGNLYTIAIRLFSMQNTMRPSTAPDLKTVLIATGFILTMAMGVRHGFGFWMQPISQAHGWTRETYSLALAVQNLMWGAFGPFAGMAVDKFGTFRVIIGQRHHRP